MPKIILTNDDGIDAPGIEALYRATERLGERIVVAPELARSGCGHTITTDDPIPIRKVREGWFSVGGTPADCARLAITRLAPDAGWLLSGINRGGNLGADIYISGTVAAAREAAFLGRRAIALSQYTRPGGQVDWEWALRECGEIVATLMNRPAGGRAFWNVNLPHLTSGRRRPPVVFCKLDLNPLDVRYRIEDSMNGLPTTAHFTGDYHQRKNDVGRDVEVCFGGRIAITEIPLDIAR
jgi:5'/3'-nucleotidase